VAVQKNFDFVLGSPRALWQILPARMRPTTYYRFHHFRLPTAFALSCAAAFGLFVSSNQLVAAPPAAFNWTGFYIGGNLGGTLNNYEFGKHENHLDVAGQYYSNIEIEESGVSETGEATFFTPRHGQTDGSPFGGGQAGFNLQFGHFLVGIEGDFNRSSLQAIQQSRGDDITFIIGNGEFQQVFGETTFDAVRKAQSNWNGSGRLRFGYAHGPFLIYGTGGVTWTDVNVWSQNTATTDFFSMGFGGERADGITPQQVEGSSFIASVTSTNLSRDEEVRTGWTGGGGIEFAFSPFVSLGLEYRHSDYGDDTHHFSKKNQITPGSTKLDLDSDQVSFKLNVLLAPFFTGGSLASTKISTPDNPYLRGGNLALAYAAADGKETMSGKDKSVAVAPEEPFTWDGPYIGAQAGGIWTDYDFHAFDTDVAIDRQFFGFNPGATSFVPFTTPAFDSQSDDSLMGGGQLGFNKQWGSIVVGVEGDFTGMSSSSETSFRATNTGFVDFAPYTGVTTLSTRQNVDVNWTASARGRVGWARGPLLLYLTGGAAWVDAATQSRITASTDFLFLGAFFAFNRTDRIGGRNEEVEIGWTGGGGAEWAFNKNFSVGLEYRHNDFGNVSTNFSRRGPAIFSNSPHVDLDSDQLAFKVNILLGHLGH
jgi:outer membrane immunogenic protein